MRDDIEALAHDLGKALQATIEGRPKDLRLRIEMPGILEEGGMRSYEIWKRLKGRRWHKKFEFVDKVLKELWVVGILERNEERRYNLKKSLESKHSPKEACFGLPSDEKIRNAITEMYFKGFSVDGIAYHVGLPELHIKLLEKVLSQTFQKSLIKNAAQCFAEGVLADEISR